VNDTILNIIRGIQDKKYSLSMNNLDRIDLNAFNELL
jgi:hypothetical protein